MFLVIQFPIADLRVHAPGTARLRAPAWPDPEIGVEFMRAVGEVKERIGGGLNNWMTEDTFCTAQRAIRLHEFKGVLTTDAITWLARCGFRRFYSNGRALAKFEIGFFVLPAHTGAVHREGTPYLMALAEAALAVEVKIPVRAARGDATDFAVCALSKAGGALAPMLARVTQSHEGARVEESLVRPGRPLVYVEHQGEIDLPGRGTRTTWHSEPRRGPRRTWHSEPPVTFSRYFTEGELRGIRAVALDTRLEPDQVRSRRTMLLRLHAEKQVLMQTLRMLETREVSQDRRGTLL